MQGKSKSSLAGALFDHFLNCSKLAAINRQPINLMVSISYTELGLDKILDGKVAGQGPKEEVRASLE
jgi:hypothetical protein